jgi:hypothetical protein
MATLIDVATPGPALAGLEVDSTSYAALHAAQTTETTAGTAYQLLSITLTAGTWVVTGVVFVVTPANQTNYLNLSTATGSNSWPIITANATTGDNMIITAVIKVAGMITVYLNGKNTAAAILVSSLLTATRIQ